MAAFEPFIGGGLTFVVWDVCGVFRGKLVPVLLAISVNGAGVALKACGGEVLNFATHLSASAGGASSRCTIRVGRVLTLGSVAPSSVRSYVVTSIIPSITGDMDHTITGLYRVIPLILNPNVGANLGVGVSGPTRLNTSLITNTINTVSACGVPYIVVSVNATAAIDILSGSDTFLNNIVTTNIELALGTLSRGATLLPSVPVRTPGSIINGGAVRYVRSNLILNATTVLSNLLRHVRTGLNRAPAIITANKLSGRVVARYGRNVVCGRGLLLRNLYTVCRGGRWNGSYFELAGIRLIDLDGLWCCCRLRSLQNDVKNGWGIGYGGGVEGLRAYFKHRCSHCYGYVTVYQFNRRVFQSIFGNDYPYARYCQYDTLQCERQYVTQLYFQQYHFGFKQYGFIFIFQYYKGLCRHAFGKCPIQSCNESYLRTSWGNWQVIDNCYYNSFVSSNGCHDFFT